MRSEKSAISNYLSRLNRESRSAFNYSLLIANYSFPQGRLNPPIRGSIEQDNALFENYNHKRQICQGRSSPFYQKNCDIFVCVKNVFNSTLHSPHSTPVNNSSTAPLSRKANEHFNPPIRGSIVGFQVKGNDWGDMYQSPYKGFNSWSNLKFGFKVKGNESQSPYKGFNRRSSRKRARAFYKVSIPL